MSGATTLVGKWGEEQAARYLNKKGWKLLAAGYRCRMGEIDLIVRKGNTLAFVEVKLRKNAAFSTAPEQVTPAKQSRIRTTAAHFLSQYPELAECICRFDVAEVYAPEGIETKRPDISYYENAFW